MANIDPGVGKKLTSLAIGYREVEHIHVNGFRMNEIIANTTNLIT